DAPFNATVVATDLYFNTTSAATGSVTLSQFMSSGVPDTNADTSAGSLSAGSATLSVESITPGASKRLQVTSSSYTFTEHLESSAFEIQVGTPSNILAVLPGETFSQSKKHIRGGPAGKNAITGTPSNQTAGSAFSVDL